MALDVPLNSVRVVFNVLVGLSDLRHLKYRAVASRTSALARLSNGRLLFAVRFLHFLLNLSVLTQQKV